MILTRIKEEQGCRVVNKKTPPAPLLPCPPAQITFHASRFIPKSFDVGIEKLNRTLYRRAKAIGDIVVVAIVNIEFDRSTHGLHL